MSTENGFQPKLGKLISLNSCETINIQRPHKGEEIEIVVKNGIIRIATNQSRDTGNITLAFACKADIFKFNYPGDLEITIEAITDATYLVKTINKTESAANDSIIDWIIQLHIVRHEKI